MTGRFRQIAVPVCALLAVLVPSCPRGASSQDSRPTPMELRPGRGKNDGLWMDLTYLYNARRWQMYIPLALRVQERRRSGDTISTYWDTTRDSELADSLVDAYLAVGDFAGAREQLQLATRARLQFGMQTHRDRESMRGQANPFAPPSLPPAVSEATIYTNIVAQAERLLFAGDTEGFLSVVQPWQSHLERLAEPDESGMAFAALGLIRLADGQAAEAQRCFSTGQKRQEAWNRRWLEEIQSWSRRMSAASGVAPENDAEFQSALLDAMNTQAGAPSLLTAALSRDWQQIADQLQRLHRAYEYDTLHATNGWAFNEACPNDEFPRTDIRLRQSREAFQLCAIWDSSLVTVGLEQTLNLRGVRMRSVDRFARRSGATRQSHNLIGQACGISLLRFPPESRAAAQQDTLRLLRQASESMREAENAAALETLNASGERGGNLASFFRPPDWIDATDCQSQMSAGQAVLEIVHARTIDVAQADSGFALTEPLYGAWLLQPTGAPRFVVLGTAAEIEPLVRNVLILLNTAAEEIAQYGDEQATARADRALSALSQRILVPFEEELQNISELTICPDADLWLVPWSALPLSGGQALIDQCVVALRFSAAELTLPQPPVPTRRGPATVFSNPDCDAFPAAVRAAEEKLFRGKSVDPLRVEVRDGRPMFAPFSRLPGTDREARAIIPVLEDLTGQRPHVFSQDRALESVVYALRGPEYLVFQSHGFSLGDRFEPVDSDSAFIPRGRFADREPAGEVDRLPLALDDPLARCGLALAGANHCHQWQEVRSADGILTAREVAFLNLMGTRLVVLSACQTGVGQARPGEGISGLRLAFEMAGAESVVASLWPVDDEATADLMADFFSRLRGNVRPAVALHHAQLQARDARRTAKGAAHPYFWAAFNVSGN